MSSCRLRASCLIVVLPLIVVSTRAQAATWFVDADAPGPTDGLSWATAFTHPQDALAAAGATDTIRVARGTYMPDGARLGDGGYVAGSGDRDATFQLINGVILEGGYVGFGGVDPDLRDIAGQPTLLSGDLDNDDAAFTTPADLLTESTRNENSRHVVTGSGADVTAIIDGFTITAGRANGSANNGRGGGMLNDAGSPTVRHCIFTANTAEGAAAAGGGMHNRNSSLPTVIGCVFLHNASSQTGGGMENRVDSDATVTSCKFLGNHADTDGGGMGNNNDSAPVLTNVLFSGNAAGGNGGALFCADTTSPIVTNCTFNQNTADGDGGGMWYEDGALVVVNCIFWGNIDDADGNAGGPYMDRTAQGHTGGSGSAAVTYSCIQDIDPNDAIIPYGGAANNNIDDDPLFEDADGADNVVGTLDDNLRPQFSTSPCIDAGDNAAIPGGVTTDLDGNPRRVDDPAVVDTGNGTAPIVDMGAYEQRDCDNNGESEGADSDGDGISDLCDISFGNTATRLSHSGGLCHCHPPCPLDNPDDTDNDGVCDSDDPCPLDSPDDTDFDGICDSDDLCYGDNATGDSDSDTVCDNLDACPGLDDRTACDPPADVICVRAGSPGVADGSNWYHAYNDLRSALLAATAGDEIWVAAGTYMPDGGYIPVGGTFTPGIGGRAHSFTLLNSVLIVGGFAGTENERDQRDLFTHKTILSGDINGNNAPGGNSYNVVVGDGTAASAVLNGFTITGGNAEGAGSSQGRGGGIRIENGNARITFCTFLDNTAKFTGGGAYIELGSPRLNHCTFSGNSARDGGGVYCDASNLQLNNCVFTGNFTEGAGTGGGGMYIFNASPSITNCTFAENRTLQSIGRGGGVYSTLGSPDIANSIFWGNEDNNQTGSALQFEQITGVPFVRYCCIQDEVPNDGSIPFGAAGQGNTDRNPKFVDLAGPDFVVGTADDNPRLSLGTSPCIDAGDNAEIKFGIGVDRDGNPRRSEALTAPNDGNGSPPIVDMGAYEQRDCDGNNIDDLLEPDTDGDGVTDACDLCEGDDAIGDSDDDGVCDDLDLCPGTQANEPVDANGCPTNPPVLTAAVSRKTHGGAGDFDIDLISSAATGATECRSGGPTRIVITFDADVAVEDGSLDIGDEITVTANLPGPISVNNQAITGNVLSFMLSGVPDGSCLSITLHGIARDNGAGGLDTVMSDQELQQAVRSGDTTDNGKVSSADVNHTSNNTGPTTGAKARNDINSDGVVDGADANHVKSATNALIVVCP